MRGLKRSVKLIAVLLVLLTCLGFSPWAMDAEKVEAATDPTTIFSSSEHGGWVVNRDTYGTVNSVALSGAATDSFEWSGNSCDVVLDSATAPDATVTLSTVISGRFVSNCYMKYNSTAKKGANTSFAVQLSDGSATVTLKPYYSQERLSGTTKTINITTAEDLGEVTEISITNPPDKIEYYATQTFDPTGMVVTATYDSGETRTIKNSNLEFSPSVVQNDTTEITVSYEGFEATQPITVIQLPKSSAMIDYSTSNGSLDRVDIQNADGTDLEEVTGITIDGTTINVSLDRAIDKSAQVKAVFSLTQNNNLPFLSTNNTMRAGNYKSTTYSTTLSNGNGSATAYLYNVNPSATNNPYVTFRVVYRTQNDPPNRKGGVDQSSDETVVAESPFTLDLSQIFEDPDNDELTYKVSLDDADPVNAEEQYSFLTNQKGSHTLVFSATDEYNAVSTDTYTINLTVERKEGTHYITHTNGTGYTTEAAGGSSSPVNEGSSYTVKLNLAQGYQRGADFAVKANGTALEEDSEGSNTFTISNITADQEITVEGVVEQKPVIIAPAGSTITLGTGPGGTYYKYSFIAPVSTETLPDGRVMNTYDILSDSNLFYRVQNPNGVTYWNYFATKLNRGDRIEITPEQLHMDDDTFNSDTVYHDFQYNYLDLADIYLNINERNYLSMSAGGTYELNSFRNWFAIESFTNNKVALPDMRYEVVDINGNPSDLVTITPNTNNSCVANVRAGNETGMALIKITYDAMYYEQGYASGYGAGGPDSKRFSAIWPDATGIIVVTVGADGSGINMGMTINEGKTAGKSAGTKLDAEHDPLFYVGDEGTDYTFSPEEGTTVTVARPTVGDKSLNYSGFSSEGISTDDDGNVTISGLTNGRNIVKVEKGGVANYQIITARKIKMSIKDSNGQEVEADHQFNPGETLTVSLSNVTSPGEKLSGYYNNSFTLAYYGEDDPSTKLGDTMNHPYGQYNFSSLTHSFAVTIPEDWDRDTYKLINGAIAVGGFSGGAFGSHRTCTYATGKGMTNGTPGSGILGRLPEITLNVKQEIQLPPVRKDGVSAEVSKELADGESYSVDLSEIFEDPNDDPMTYKVSVDDGEFAACDKDYAYTMSGSDPVKLVFKANDGTADSTDTYTVNLMVKETVKPKVASNLKVIDEKCRVWPVYEQVIFDSAQEHIDRDIDPSYRVVLPEAMSFDIVEDDSFESYSSEAVIRDGDEGTIFEGSEGRIRVEKDDIQGKEDTAGEVMMNKYSFDPAGYGFDEDRVILWIFNNGAIDPEFPRQGREGYNIFVEYDENVEDPETIEHCLTKVPAKAETCEKTGNSEYCSCDRCGRFFSDEEGNAEIEENSWVIAIDPNAHKWGDWKVTKKATEHAEGEETRRCEHNDTHFETRTIDKLAPAKTTDTVKKVLVAKGIAKGKTKGKISWNNVKADRYIVYLSLCDHKGKTYKLKKVKTVSGKTHTWTKGKLKKNVWYKFKVVAQKKVNGKYKNIATSKVAHMATGNVKGKYTNPKSLKLSKSKISLKKGKTMTIKGTVTKVKKKKALPTSHAPKLRFISNNPKVATVSAKGKVTAKSKGKATIYVQTINGIWKTCKVTVK